MCESSSLPRDLRIETFERPQEKVGKVTTFNNSESTTERGKKPNSAYASLQPSITRVRYEESSNSVIVHRHRVRHAEKLRLSKLLLRGWKKSGSITNSGFPDQKRRRRIKT